MTTKFIHTRLDVAPGLVLVLDGNSKITAGNGTYAEPVPNALSLPAASVEGGASYCPHSTETCRASCYVKGLAKYAPEVYAAYHENARTISALLSYRSHESRHAAEVLARWVDDHAQNGFRWHVSGDVWNEAHAEWIVKVATSGHPMARHWIYTRNAGVLPILARAGRKLAVNFSADRDNYSGAAHYAIRNGARIAYMATTAKGDGIPDDLPDGSVIFPDYPLRGREMPDPTEHPWWIGLGHKRRLQVCPADFFGQSEAHRCGPCSKCMRAP